MVVAWRLDWMVMEIGEWGASAYLECDWSSQDTVAQLCCCPKIGAEVDEDVEIGSRGGCERSSWRTVFVLSC